jgi:hypothetical protein
MGREDREERGQLSAYIILKICPLVIPTSNLLRKPPHFLLLPHTNTPSMPTSDLEATMKLIIAGATSLLGTEIVRQSPQIREITQVISLALQPVQIDKSIDTSKLKNVVIRDYSEYPDDVKSEFAGADACIW